MPSADAVQGPFAEVSAFEPRPQQAQRQRQHHAAASDRGLQGVGAAVDRLIRMEAATAAFGCGRAQTPGLAVVTGQFLLDSMAKVEETGTAPLGVVMEVHQLEVGSSAATRSTPQREQLAGRMLGGISSQESSSAAAAFRRAAHAESFEAFERDFEQFDSEQLDVDELLALTRRLISIADAGA